jgi:hypothetical protein
MSFGYSVLGFGGYTNRFSISNFGGRGIFAGEAVIDYVAIATNGNATDFGDLAGSKGTGCSNGSRGVATTTNDADGIKYITISTPGDAQDFGNLTSARSNGMEATSNHLDRGLFMGGYVGGTASNIIDYITISAISNATDFGDLNVGSW